MIDGDLYEPFRSRWKRRAKTIPIMLGGTAVAIVFAPLLVAGAAVYDILRLRLRLPTVRVYLFLLQYLTNDSAEIVLAGVYWLAAGFGVRLGSPASVRRHQRLQEWSMLVLARRAVTLLGLRFEVDVSAQTALLPVPAIVLCRHVSVIDASLPPLLYQRVGVVTRGVIMAEMLADPGFDLLYGRTGSVFIQRDSGPDALDRITRLGRRIDATSVACIFPEGRLYRPAILAHLQDRIAARDPVRGKRVAALRHVLPPRPGGTLALLDALPDADVVVVAHAGLDHYPALLGLAREVPLAVPVRVTAWRVPRSEIPLSAHDREVWLDDQWQRVDDFVDSVLSCP